MHVVNRASRSRFISRVIVATDDERIASAAHRHGAEARLTSQSAASGTDRVAEVAASIDAAIVVNVQGDEPLIEPSTIDSAIEPLIHDPAVRLATTSEPITSVEEVFSPRVVKVVTDREGFALYFSRSPVPHIGLGGDVPLAAALDRDRGLLTNYRKHTGLYVYRKEALLQLATTEPSHLERLEVLEQLRAIENGFKIRVVPVEHRSIGVDTRQDYEKVRQIIEENAK